jgi:hypothetical protein
MSRAREYCSVCLSSHDAEIHAATRRIHDWLRREVNRLFVNAGSDSDGEEQDYPAGDTATSV